MGEDSSRLDYDSFVNLLKGETITIERTNFNVDWKDLNINVVRSNILIQGLTDKIKTLENIRDVNYKFISFPKKYNIIKHPIYYVTHRDIDLENKINKTNYTKLSVLEIITVFIFLFSFVSLFSLFLYKIS